MSNTSEQFRQKLSLEMAGSRHLSRRLYREIEADMLQAVDNGARVSAVVRAALATFRDRGVDINVLTLRSRIFRSLRRHRDKSNNKPAARRSASAPKPKQSTAPEQASRMPAVACGEQAIATEGRTIERPQERPGADSAAKRTNLTGSRAFVTPQIPRQTGANN